MTGPVGRVGLVGRVLNWIDSRTAYRTLIDHALNEPLPPGTGWKFTTGSVVTLLIGSQLLTGVVLSMYYVPAPSLAYDSVRFIMHDLSYGSLVRGLHFWGASFLVVAAAVHMLRVFLTGSYKAPRELTWITGLVLLLLILGFSLSGYLLPWDQKAYWATTVTINVAKGTPIAGDLVANIMRGGPDLGALTLGRWFSAHVFLLPATLILFIVAHIRLMRLHGISGPITPKAGPVIQFFPWHVIKDTVMMAAVFTSLFVVAWTLPAHLDEIANPADANYVPRPEWYFLSLFQLLKYFPGPLEPVATMVIPGVVFGFLFLLPFMDRGASRHPLKASRVFFTLIMASIVGGVVTLTTLGFKDRPAGKDLNDWGLLPIAGFELVTGPDSTCVRCHEPGGPAPPMPFARITKDEEWLLTHMADPVAIAPGVRTVSDPAPKPVMSRFQAQAVVSYLRRMHAGAVAPAVSHEMHIAATTYADICVRCHMISGEGGKLGPDLTHVGKRRPASEIRDVIEDATAVYGDSAMPTFRGKLSEEQFASLVAYLAARK